MPINDHDNDGRSNGDTRDGSDEREAAGEGLSWEPPDCPPEGSAQFWRSVAAYEMACQKTSPVSSLVWV